MEFFKGIDQLREILVNYDDISIIGVHDGITLKEKVKVHLSELSDIKNLAKEFNKEIKLENRDCDEYTIEYSIEFDYVILFCIE